MKEMFYKMQREKICHRGEGEELRRKRGIQKIKKVKNHYNKFKNNR